MQQNFLRQGQHDYEPLSLIIAICQQVLKESAERGRVLKISGCNVDFLKPRCNRSTSGEAPPLPRQSDEGDATFDLAAARRLNGRIVPLEKFISPNVYTF
jgi:hypothetical protein